MRALRISLTVLILFSSPCLASDMSQLTVLNSKNNSVAKIQVEIADDDIERDQGLMNRLDVPRGTGMLFLFTKPQLVNFWMKNTLVSLDIIFILPDLSIGKIHYNARPHDLTAIPSDLPVIAVLEVGAGEAARFGLKKGQKIRHPMLAAP